MRILPNYNLRITEWYERMTKKQKKPTEISIHLNDCAGLNKTQKFVPTEGINLFKDW